MRRFAQCRTTKCVRQSTNGSAAGEQACQAAEEALLLGRDVLARRRRLRDDLSRRTAAVCRGGRMVGCNLCTRCATGTTTAAAAAATATLAFTRNIIVR